MAACQMAIRKEYSIVETDKKQQPKLHIENVRLAAALNLLSLAFNF